VAKDSDRPAMFLTNVIGCKEVKGFEVSGDLGKKRGLIDGHATQAWVFVLEEVEQATRIKLFSFPKAPGRSNRIRHIGKKLIVIITIRISADNRSDHQPAENPHPPAARTTAGGNP